MSRKRGCMEPAVQKCLNCPKKDCDACWNAHTDISEIRALIYAGMLRPTAISLYYRNKKIWKSVKTGRGNDN